MKREGFVSLFIGSSDSYEELQKYVSGYYTEEGEARLSQFEKDFRIENDDDDFIEVEFYSESLKELRLLLKGFSCDKEIIPKFINACGEYLERKVNAVILIYDFQYMSVKDVVNQFQFLGAVQYIRA